MNIKEYIKLDKNELPLDNIIFDGGYFSIFKSVCVIGDSLAAGEFEAYLNKEKEEKEYFDFKEYSWPYYIGLKCGCSVYNFSKGGMSALEYDNTFADANDYWNSKYLSQAYIIALGENDLFWFKREVGSIKDICLEDYHKNKESYVGEYAKIIQKIKLMQPKAKIFVLSTPKHGDESDEKRKELRDALNDIAKIFSNIYLVDLYEYAPLYDYEFQKRFYLGHMTPSGYYLTSIIILSYLDYIIRHNQEDFREIEFIGTSHHYL